MECLPAMIPARLKRLINRCLQKDPYRDRLHDIADARIELEDALEDSTGSSLNLEAASVSVQPASLPRYVLPLAFGLAAVVGIATWQLKPATPMPLVQAEISLPEGEFLTHLFRHAFDVSPDGSSVAFVAGVTDSGTSVPDRFQLWTRSLRESQATPLPGTENGLQPIFSPDGAWIVFLAREDGQWNLKKVASTGGDTTTLLEGSGTLGASWGPGGTIVVGRLRAGLGHVSASGAKLPDLTKLDLELDEVSHRLPHFLPDGETVLFTSLSHSVFIRDPAWLNVHAVSLSTRQRKLLIEGASDARYVPTDPGYLVFAREGRLMKVPFDPGRVELTGPELPLLEGVSQSMYHGNAGNDTGAAQFAFSQTGLLAYVPGSVLPEPQSEVVWVDRTGAETPLGIDPGGYATMRVSPDGRAVMLTASYAPRRAALLFDLERRTTRRQTFGDLTSHMVWGPQEDHFSFVSSREGPNLIYTKKLNSGPQELSKLISESSPVSSQANLLEVSSPCAKEGLVALVVGLRVEGSWNYDIWVLSDDGTTEPLLVNEFNEYFPDFSPDCRWLTYTSTESGVREVYIRPYPDGGSSVQVLTGGGGPSVWSRDGSEILYRKRGQFFAASVTISGRAVNVGRPVELFEGRYASFLPVRHFDVAPDGRFLLRKLREPDDLEKGLRDLFPTRFRIVQNWFSELSDSQ